MSMTLSSGPEEAHLLLVEDNDDDAFLFEKKIEQGIEYAFVDEISVTRARTISEAVELCEIHSFDATFLDLGLPKSSGPETVERFTDHDVELPIIVLTGLQDNEAALDAIRKGAQDYLVKGDSTSESIVRAMRHAIERRQNEQKVRRQRDQLEFFNSILRHDMLNGMQIIQMHAQSLESRVDGQALDDAETIVNWSDNIIDLTRKTRDIIDAVTSNEEADLQAIRLGDVLDPLVAETEDLRDGVTVETDYPGDIEVSATELLEDMLRNLLTNAVEHTRPEPVTITVRASKTNGSVRLVVEDDGPGIPADQRDHIFERGETGEGSTGSGFGLYFVKSMAETYGGSVRFEPGDPGARFILELSVAQSWHT